MGVKQAIVLRNDLGMGKGKLVVQGCHASLLAWEEASEREAGSWQEDGMKKIVLKVSGEKELKKIFQEAKKARLPCSIVKDAGLTQLTPGTATAVAIGPCEEKKIDAITGELKLL